MRNLVLGLSLSVALIVGANCGSAVPGKGEVSIKVPPMRPGTNPPKWEYFCFWGRSGSGFLADANALGRQGWELVTFSGSFGCFKRRLP